MSMDFSEFKRRLGAEPSSADPAVAAARDASPEHRAYAEDAERFETQLERAVAVAVPDTLIDDIRRLPGKAPHRKFAWPAALAASVLVAVGAAGVAWQMNSGWDSVEDYVTDHYRHDGDRLVTESLQAGRGDVHELLAEFGLDATPALADAVSVVKRCPTPGGEGVHMVLHTASGPLTVIYMPDTAVTDHAKMAFDDKAVVLVALERGSAAIIGQARGPVESYYAVVHDGIVTLSGRS